MVVRMSGRLMVMRLLMRSACRRIVCRMRIWLLRCRRICLLMRLIGRVVWVTLFDDDCVVWAWPGPCVVFWPSDPA